MNMFYESQSRKLHFVQGEESLWLENFQYTICGKVLQSKASLADYSPENICKACKKKYEQDPELNKEVMEVIHG